MHSAEQDCYIIYNWRHFTSHQCRITIIKNKILNWGKNPIKEIYHAYKMNQCFLNIKLKWSVTRTSQALYK